MYATRIFALGLLGCAAVLAYVPAHAAQPGQKEPTTGKSCVSFFSADTTEPGRQRLYFRNICASSFQIRIEAGTKVREGTIEAGSPAKPAKAHVTCNADERCDSAKWRYE